MRWAAVVVVAACGGAKPAPAPVENRVVPPPAPAVAKCQHDCLPDVKLVDFRGHEHAVAGKVVVVTFIATWCRPCQKQLQPLAALDNVVVLTVVTDSPSDDELEQFMKDWEAPNVPVIRATPDILTAWNNPQALPTTFIYDRTGTQVFTHVGPRSKDELAAVVQKLPATPTP